MTFVANQPGGAERLLAIHGCLNDGYCRGCVSSNTSWPCSTATIALAVLDRDRDAKA
ncbi:MAG: hypothetical protein ACRDRH_26690 [Pseudonocardia sp.]